MSIDPRCCTLDRSRVSTRNRPTFGASPFKELTALVDQQQGETWRSVAADVKSRLGVRQLERLEPARRTRVLKLLEKLQQELQGA